MRADVSSVARSLARSRGTIEKERFSFSSVVDQDMPVSRHVQSLLTESKVKSSDFLATDAEMDRLQAVEDIGNPSAGSSRELNDLCSLARQVFDVPTAYISLIGKDLQWFKASEGLDSPPLPRSLALCNVTITSDTTLVINDAREDARVKDHPLVRSGDILFYAGAPLVVSTGVRLGSFCLLDNQPREFDHNQAERLAAFARIAVGLMRQEASARDAARHSADSESRKLLVQQQEKDIARQHRIMKQTERLAQVGGWELRLTDDIVHWSDEVYRIAELPVGTPTTLDTALNLFAGSDRVAFKQALARARHGEPLDTTIQLAQGPARGKYVRITGEVEFSEGQAVRMFGAVQDITGYRKAQEQLWSLANHDPLTGLANRTFFHEKFTSALEKTRSANDKLALLFIDLDYFKNINDTRGHDVGNSLLQAIADRLQSIVGPQAIVGRLGGDEFAIVLPRVRSVDDARLIAGQVIAEAGKPLQWGSIASSCSVGIAMFPEGGQGTKELMQNADLALYRAKFGGRSRAEVFLPSYRTEFEDRLNQISEFRTALREGALEAYYQPQFTVADGHLHGFEALVRWRQPDGTLSSAAAFSAALEDSDNLIALGQYMLGTVVNQLALWIEQNLNVKKVSVNAASPELRTGNYPRQILELLATKNIDPSLIEVEITESVVLESTDYDIEATLYELRRAGITIAMDDFGTGFASLSHLKRFPLDQIKIDRSFISGLTASDEDEAIVKAMIDLAANLGLDTVAEGVETPDQLTCLTKLGCKYVQGFLTGRPVPASEAAQLLSPTFLG